MIGVQDGGRKKRKKEKGKRRQQKILSSPVFGWQWLPLRRENGSRQDLARGVSIRAFSRENAKVSLSLPRLLNCKFPASVVPLAGVYICCYSRLLGCWFLGSWLQYYYPPLKVWDHPSAYLSGASLFLIHSLALCLRVFQERLQGVESSQAMMGSREKIHLWKRRERWERMPTDFSKSSVTSPFFMRPKSLLESSSLSISLII